MPASNTTRRADVLKFVPPKTGHAKAKATQTVKRPYAGKKPRCRCGCGKEALWPRGPSPVFHTRKCGYELALKLVRPALAAGPPGEG